MAGSTVAEGILAPSPAQARPAMAAARQLYVALAVFFLLNLVPVGLIALTNDKTFNDALKYYDTATGLYEGQGFARAYKDDVRNPATAPPFPVQGRFLFPYVVARVFNMLGPAVQTANAVAALGKALLVIPLFLLALEFFSYPAAVAAAALYTFSPFYFDMGVRSMPETLVSTLYYVALLCLVVYVRQPRRGLLVAAGLGAALAYLTRPEALLLAVFGLALTWFAAPRKVDIVFFLAPALATMLLGSWLVYGRPGGLDYTETSLATLPTWWDAYALQSFDWQRYLAQVGGPWGKAQITMYNYLRFARNVFSDGLLIDTQTGLLPLLFLPLLILPLARPRGVRAPRLLRATAAFMLVQAAVTLGYPGYPGLSTEVRHGQIIAPFLLILAGGGLAQLWQLRPEQTARRRRSERGAALLLAGCYAVFSLASLTVLVNFFVWIPPYRGGVEQGGEWARGTLAPDSVIMSRRVTDAHFFSQRTAIVTPTGPVAEILDYARRNHVTHILIADQDRQAVPNLVEAIAAYPANFRLVHTSGLFQLVEVASYDFGGQAPRVPGDAAVEQGINARPALDWPDLLALRPQHTLGDAWQAWGQWYLRVRTGQLAISHQEPRIRSIEHPLALRLGDALELAGYDLRPAVPAPGSTVHLTLYWRPTGQITADYTVFAHLLCGNGRMCSQADSQPLKGAYPTSRWHEDGIVQDDYDLSVPAGQPGPYQVEAGMYLLQTGQRLPMTEEGGKRLEQDRVLLQPG